MTLYRISNDKVCIGLISDEGTEWGTSNSRNRRIVDAPPFAKWAIGKETYHVIRWFKQRGFTVQGRRLPE